MRRDTHKIGSRGKKTHVEKPCDGEIHILWKSMHTGSEDEKVVRSCSCPGMLGLWRSLITLGLPELLTVNVCCSVSKTL